MELKDILPLYAGHPQVAGLGSILERESTGTVFCEGLRASAAPVVFAALTQRSRLNRPFLFLLNDEEEAGYFYHDLVQLLGEDEVLFFPSTYRRAVK